MQNPREREVQTRMQETGIVPLDSLEEADLERLEPATLPYKKEPLFNKKVMLAWAIGAAVVWFAMSFVLPIAFESAKTAILQSIKEAEGTGSNVIIERNGRTITIKTEPARPAPGAAAAGAASATAGPIPPALPAKPAQPAQAPVKKTEPARR